MELAEEPEVSIKDLYRYFNMCLSVWRKYDKWKETGWELDYFEHKETNTLAVAIPQGDTLYLAFRGSQAPDNKVDLKLNLRITKMKIPFAQEGRVRAHKGFLQKYLGIRDDLFKRVANYAPKRIVITGISGGGSLGALAFMDLKNTYPDMELKTITFGMPRTFNRPAAIWFDQYEDKLLRLVMGRDIAANVPPALLGYRHIGRLVRMGRRSLLPFSFRDHWPGYRDELRALLEAEGSDPRELGY